MFFPLTDTVAGAFVLREGMADLRHLATGNLTGSQCATMIMSYSLSDHVELEPCGEMTFRVLVAPAKKRSQTAFVLPSDYIPYLVRTSGTGKASSGAPSFVDWMRKTQPNAWYDYTQTEKGQWQFHLVGYRRGDRVIMIDGQGVHEVAIGAKAAVH